MFAIAAVVILAGAALTLTLPNPRTWAAHVQPGDEGMVEGPV